MLTSADFDYLTNADQTHASYQVLQRKNRHVRQYVCGGTAASLLCQCKPVATSVACRMVARRDNEGVSKQLFKRKRGLSKFYANKAQSFSSLDHALSTCMGHSALALEKPKPRTSDASSRSDVDVEVLCRLSCYVHHTLYLARNWRSCVVSLSLCIQA